MFDADGALSQAEILDLQADMFADDVPILPEMQTWTRAEVISYFETGVPPSAKGAPGPPPAMRLACSLC